MSEWPRKRDKGSPVTHILVVDDSATDRALAGGLLQRIEGFEVRYATGGLDALREIDTHPPDLVLTDLNMPDLDGLELLGAIQRKRPDLPVILMTGRGSEWTAVRALKTGAASYVPKDSLAMLLVETVQQVRIAARQSQAQVRLASCVQHQEIQFQLPNEPEVLASLVQYLQDALAGMGGCNQTERVRFGVAMQEALTNACFHGNLEISSSLKEGDMHRYYDLARERSQQSPYRDRRIEVLARMTGREVFVQIRDEGPGFDPHMIPNPTNLENLERPSGRGLLLMQTFMDEIHYNELGNQVTMIKRCVENACPLAPTAKPATNSPSDPSAAIPAE